MSKSKQIKVNPVFVKTRNVRNFETLMDGLALADGEGRLGLVYGRAGRGKTRTSQWYAANNRCVYLRVVNIWSELDFLKALCRELGVINPPHRKGLCFSEIVERLVAYPAPVFLDEIEKLSRSFLDTIRDITDITGAPFILVGEEELVALMRQNRRVWSRTFQQIEFSPITVADVIAYAGEATGLKMEMEAGKILHEAAGGDFRLVKRDLLTLVQYANAKNAAAIDADLARVAVKSGLSGK